MRFKALDLELKQLKNDTPDTALISADKSL